MDAPTIKSRSKFGRALTCLVPASELQLGMHVKIDDAPYMWGTVEIVDHDDRSGGPLGSVTLVRPFIHAPGPAMAVAIDAISSRRSVTCYTGLERVKISRDRKEPFEVSCETHPYFTRWLEP